ncbi:hypothetical protein B0A48_03457 [Cryoendolithus antarcticus]|uniref:Transcription factor domain-containing protein n=1 Tax=Cryoendolithus antarcticus TaxID=1507870 RepID=A0A1V8TK20_9PEZI|nr:hypothetical protein B0A48_03457 [Cryoendolithus antarcticus]
MPLLDADVTTWDFNDLIWHDTAFLDHSTDWLNDFQPGSDISTSGSANRQASIPHGSVRSTSNNAVVQSATSPTSSVEGSHTLVEYFLASDVPPILATVEVGPRWTSCKMLFASLASTSPMARNAITAFSALQIARQSSDGRSNHQSLYQKASRQLSQLVVATQQDFVACAVDLPAALATVFFLSYCDLLTNKVDNAHGLFKDALSLLQCHKARNLTLVEKRLVSWIRLVDGRASSAGGDGSFLSGTDGNAYSPEAHQRSAEDDKTRSSAPQDADVEIQEILFDILYAPGLAFYQQVQSIMARVSNIDPWHRSRGTVEDETQVMATAAEILTDLRDLERKRPPLMDFAVAGTLTERHVTQHIATAITRSYRTYWANFEAGFIHLHRVAHKHLPPTPDVLRARATIKKVVRLFEQSSEALPTNFIWPLLMACCEEDDFEDRAWMIRAIRSMQAFACNAQPIADVLEEVHKRQDTTKVRADVRQVSMDMFNMSFAVV